MTKLKTLKDIKKDFRDVNKGRNVKTHLRAIHNSFWAVREEAIKWVKETMKSMNYKSMVNVGLFCEFFNITEEDLQ